MALGQCNPQSKLLWHVDRLYQFKETGTTKPLIFEIDPSNKCNQDCPWCSFSKLRSESKEMMCRERMIELVYELKDLGVKAINWTGGGEPLMNQALPDVIFHAHNAGLDQGIFTNGLLMNPKCGEFIAQRLSWIRVSVDGYDEASYAKSHGTSGKAFGVVLKNIEHVVKTTRKATIGMGFIINEYNHDGVEKVVNLAKGLGVSYIQLKPVAYRPYQKQISKEMVSKFYETAKEMEKHSTEDFNVMVTHYRFQDMMSPENNYGRTYKKCLSHHFQGAIGADSKVYLCDHHKGEKDYELGDLNKNTLKEIWNSPQRWKVIQFLDSTDLSQCQACCRNHETNKLLWHMKTQPEEMHPNHI